MAAIVFSLITALSQQAFTRAGPQAVRAVPQSLLPQTVGVGIGSDDAILVSFDEPMNTTSVEAALEVVPMQAATARWNADLTQLSLAPDGLWQPDEGYVVVIGESATTADGDATGVRRFSFTTQPAPRVSDFQVRLAEVDLPQADRADLALGALSVEHGLSAQETLTPAETARSVSASSSVRIGFSSLMDRPDVESSFTITPAAEGDLSWIGRDLVFTPTEALERGGRYTISLVGAHDRVGNELGGKASFSFVVRAGPQLTRTTPQLDASDIEPATVEMWFSQPMDVDATNEAFSLTDTSTGRLVAGRLNWNEAGTQLVYSPDRAFAGGRTFEVGLGAGAMDADGNSMTASWSFSTKAGPVVAAGPGAAAAVTAPATQRGAAAAQPAAVAVPPPPAPPPAPVAPAAVGASGLEEYGLSQINSARAARGLYPLVLDWTMSAVAAAHAWDQLTYGYYSHSSRNGASVQQRLAGAGVGFSAAGENQCHRYGWGPQQTMDWCHSVFMSEPCCDAWNHIRNILSSRYTRVGIGVASNGSRVVITWDFAN